MSEEKSLAKRISDEMKAEARKAYLEGYAKGVSDTILDFVHGDGSMKDIADKLMNDLGDNVDELMDTFIDFNAYADGERKEERRAETLSYLCEVIAGAVQIATIVGKEEQSA